MIPTRFFVKQFLFALLLFPASVFSQTKITLGPENIIRVFGNGFTDGLFDEQVLAGDPVGGTGGNVQTEYAPIQGAYAVYYPNYKIIIDLKNDYQLSHISLYDGSNVDSLWIKAGSPTNFQPLVSISTNQYNSWRNFPVNVTTRYVELTIRSSATVIKELVLYGTSLGTPEPEPPITQATPARMGDLMGTNALIINTLDEMKCVGFIREYHNWQWDEGNDDTSYPGYPANQYAWNPSWVSGAGWGWNFDAYYDSLSAAGITAMPCLQTSAPYIFNFSGQDNESKPIASNEDAYQPQSYVEHADYMYQFAARFGSTNVPTANLKLRATNEAVSGLNTLHWMENWNEPNKDWKGNAGFFNAYQYAAMSSADYDGHLGTLGAQLGLKNADPNMQFSMAGIISLNLDYIKGLRFWCDAYRNGDFMFDAINLHHYSNDAGGQTNQSPTTGISPEADSLYQKAKAIVDYRNQYLPGVEVMISEFGYDTHPASVQRAPAIGAADAEEVQGQWLIRSWLALAAAGVDKAVQFMLSDNNSTSATKYASSGLISYPGSGDVRTPKKSWYYTYTTKHLLNEYVFDTILDSGNPAVWVYRFQHASEFNKYIYALWCPSASGATVANYSLNLGNEDPIFSCVQTQLQANDTLGLQTTISLSGNTALVNVSERPLFVSVVTSPGMVKGLIPTTPIQLFPNPATTAIRIRAEVEVNQVYIFNSLGQIVLQQAINASDFTLPVAQFAPGIYAVKLITAQGTVMKSLVRN